MAQLAEDIPVINHLPDVTAEMVLAGKEEISCRWIEFVHGPGSEELWDEVLRAVYRAMWAAKPQ